MKFYNREPELAQLARIEALSQRSAQMTFVTGRRRIGKTMLLTKDRGETAFVYLFAAKKNEALLCSEFVGEIERGLGVKLYGEIRTFRDIFAFLMDLSKERHFTVVIDEFQEFISINPSVYSDMQRIWDQEKHDSRINLILCGSVYSLMTRIFQNAREPLFGRATQRIAVKPFDIGTLKEILGDYYAGFTPDDLLAFFLVTGGVAKYVELLASASAFTLEAMLDELLAENSLFLEEGRNVLIEEFGKEYGNYFSILSLIASGKTSRAEIESMMEMQTGGFLDRLENDYGIIKKVRPVLAKPGSRVVKYRIQDNFLSFWFRFIYKYRSAVEIGNLEYLKNIIRRDYATYSGMILEKYFLEKFIAEKKYNLVGTYWEKGNQNEIDIVAVNDLERKVVFAEVKRRKDNISLEKLMQKSILLQRQFAGYDMQFLALSLEDM
ncbi:MAG: ATPase [Cytophagaceae bacterium SCN 52-12]|nr:MAG: ATPase [Cytophagaceae bacterium SCN 52-12]